MSLWLKKRLMVWVGVSLLGGALLWNGKALLAQGEGNNSMRMALGMKTPRIKMTRDEAAKNFVALLQLLDSGTYSQWIEPNAAMASSFSRKSENDVSGALLLKMVAQFREPNQKVTVQSEDAQTATVTVETVPVPSSRPLILIKEGDSWGVDVLETYAKWNNLEGDAKAEAVAQLTTELNRQRDLTRRSSCQSNLKQVALGIEQYVQDYDEKFPTAKNWIDVLQPYVKSEQIFKCPSVTDAKGYGYAYNSKLSRKSLSNLGDLHLDLMQYPAVYETTVLRRNAYGMGEDIAFRHSGGANYAFADGHVKWYDKSFKPRFNLKP